MDIASLNAALSGRYAIDRVFSEGGMATVYLARDLRHDRLVALKVLKEELSAPVGRQRFLREIALTARLDHPHIVPLLDSGEAAGALFYVMPYVEGESLRDRLVRERQLSLETALQITEERPERVRVALPPGARASGASANATRLSHTSSAPMKLVTPGWHS